MKRTLLNWAKLVFVAALIFWLVYTKKITLDPFRQLMQKWWLIPLALGSTFLMFLINNYRWFLLLQGQGLKVQQWKIFKLSSIGLFFNLAMPGSVSGDVLKAYYITREIPHAKMKVATSVLVDRLVGLYAIVLLAFLSVITNLEKVLSVAVLRSLGVFIFLIIGAFNLFFILGFSRRIHRHGFTDWIFKKIPWGHKLEEIYREIHSFRKGQTQFIIGMFLSLFSQSQLIASLYVIAYQLGFHVSLGAFFFVFPVGFMVTAIPISPAGIGVGQAVFLKLFYWYTGVENAMGPTLITINQVCLGILGIWGAFCYFSYRNQTHG